MKPKVFVTGSNIKDGVSNRVSGYEVHPKNLKMDYTEYHGKDFFYNYPVVHSTVPWEAACLPTSCDMCRSQSWGSTGPELSSIRVQCEYHQQLYLLMHCSVGRSQFSLCSVVRLQSHSRRLWISFFEFIK